MKRVLGTIVGGVAVLLAAAGAFIAWGSGGHVPDDAEQQVKTYATDPVAPRETLRVTTYNIGYLSGMTNNRPVDPPRTLFRDNMDAVEQLLREVNPDFVGFQEIDFGAARSYDVQQLDTLATRLGFATAAQATNWDKRYVPFPYWPPAVHFGRMHSGQAVAGRFPIESHFSIPLARPPRPFYSDAFYLDRLAQIVVFEVGNLPFVVINVHLEAFDQATREEQALQVRAILQAYTAQRLPVLLIGDFNSVFPAYLSTMPPSGRAQFQGDRTMEIISNVRDVVPGFSEGLAATGTIPGTFPADNPTRKIDHVLVAQQRLNQVDSRVDCIPPGASSSSNPPSDHCAVSMTVTFPQPTDMSADERRAFFDLVPPQDSVRAIAERALESARGADGSQE